MKRGNVAHIRDYTASDDTIRLENAIFKALATTGRLDDAFAAVASKAARVDGDAHLLYDKAHGTLYYDPNDGSAENRVAFAILDDTKALTHFDFLIV